MQMKIMAGFAAVSVLTACATPQPTERPVIDALRPPVGILGACVARREWGCTTSATRDIVAIMDSAE